MNKIFLKKFRWAMILALVFVVGTTSGCETLRKKFTRRKKSETVENLNAPLLDPIDYPDIVKSAAEVYQEQYALLKVWMSDLSSIVDDNANEKKVLYTLRQIKERLIAMRALLKETLQPQMDLYLREVESLSLDFEKSAAFRNKTKILSDIHVLDRNLRNRFAPQKVVESLSAL